MIEIRRLLKELDISCCNEGSVADGLGLYSEHIEDAIKFIILAGLESPSLDFNEQYNDMIQKAKEEKES
ncbi:hypothetical protein N9F50_00575 [Akkermansiaceae bacterium]|nr:hypothetical protein [Akkermansiaceae bacterium]MDB4408725.1 hypothetical protein [Akkermansiaceae bacterium]MDB4419301.1 hypothetical protein [bacterium]